MEALAGMFGMLTVAAITPGPNNVIVLRAAIRRGVTGALPAIAGIVLGGLGVLAVGLAGAGAAFAAWPELQTVLTLAGSCYLGWLGVGLIARAASSRFADDPRGISATAPALFAFQFVNPKGWVMVLTAIAAAGGRIPWLVIAFAVIPTACLLVWSLFGAAMSRRLARPAVAMWVDRVMGALLVASALGLLVSSR